MLIVDALDCRFNEAWQIIDPDLNFLRGDLLMERLMIYDQYLNAAALRLFDRVYIKSPL